MSPTRVFVLTFVLMTLRTRLGGIFRNRSITGSKPDKDCHRPALNPLLHTTNLTITTRETQNEHNTYRIHN